jgi:hypothetical protein
MLASALVVAACSASDDPSPGGRGTAATPGGGGDGATETGGSGGSTLPGGNTDAGPGGGGPSEPSCKGLRCDVPRCPAGVTTRLTGVVHAPTRVSPEPLPNVSVFVPSAALEPFPTEVACEGCDGFLTGDPIVHALSAPDGTFTLEDVPAGKDVPLVIQSGRWRRQVTIPEVGPCRDTALSDELTRLPRNQMEGDIPKMALQTGVVDALECTLGKIVDVAELTAPTGAGRIHLYKGNGADAVPALPSSTMLIEDAATLRGYDVVLLPCDFDTPTTPMISATAIANLMSYADAGGRLFLTHGGGKWLKETTPAPYPGLVQFNMQPDPASPLPALVDTTFPKGDVFADWLVVVGVSTTRGQLAIDAPQWYVDSVAAPGQRWVYSETPPTMQHFTFNVPLAQGPDAEPCGRVLYSNFHVRPPPANAVFPGACPPLDEPLTANEKVVLFMLFDTTACVQPDEDPIGPT